MHNRIWFKNIKVDRLIAYSVYCNELYNYKSNCIDKPNVFPIVISSIFRLFGSPTKVYEKDISPVNGCAKPFVGENLCKNEILVP